MKTRLLIAIVVALSVALVVELGFALRLSVREDRERQREQRAVFDQIEHNLGILKAELEACRGRPEPPVKE